MLLKIGFVEVSRTFCEMYIIKSVSVYRRVFKESFLKSFKSFEKWLCAVLCAEPSEVAVCRAVCRT